MFCPSVRNNHPRPRRAHSEALPAQRSAAGADSAFGAAAQPQADRWAARGRRHSRRVHLGISCRRGGERLRALSVGGEGWVIPGLGSEKRAGLIGLDFTPLPERPDGRYLDATGRSGTLDAVPGAPAGAGQPVALAKSPNPPDPAARAPEPVDDFHADWNARPASQIARKIAWLA